MEFEISKLGNRICIKTIKETYCKITFFTVEEAKRIINNLIKKNFKIIFLDMTCEILWGDKYDLR